MLFSELAEPTPRKRSPESECCISSESGEVYWPEGRPETAEVDLML